MRLRAASPPVGASRRIPDSLPQTAAQLSLLSNRFSTCDLDHMPQMMLSPSAGNYFDERRTGGGRNGPQPTTGSNPLAHKG